jgi:hypothetical protein
MSDIEDDYTFEEEDTLHVSDLEIGDILEFERKLGPFTYYHCGNYAGIIFTVNGILYLFNTIT